VRTVTPADLPPTSSAGEARLPGTGSAVGVVTEPGDAARTRQVIAFAAASAQASGCPIVALVAEPTAVAEDVARAVADWAAGADASSIVTSTSPVGREIAGRVGVRLGNRTPVVSAPETAGSSPAKEGILVPRHTLSVRPRGRVRVVSRTG
jgi:hypothetical protein